LLRYVKPMNGQRFVQAFRQTAGGAGIDVH
jgi:hypothetical protein